MATLTRRGLSSASAHPYLLLFGGGLLGVWLITGATWTTGPSGRLELSPIAVTLQYLLVVFAASLAGYRLRSREHDERPQVQFGFSGRRWAIPHDTGGRSFWTGVWVGIVAMEINVALFIVAEALATDTDISSVIGEYLGWIGSGIAAGALLGTFSAFIPLVAMAIRRAARA